MDLAFYIYSFLKERNSRVEVPDFGIFKIEREHAVVDKESSKILPPCEHIYFEDNTAVFDQSLAHFIVEKTGNNLFEVQTQIKETVRGWVKLLLTQKTLNLQYLGELNLKEVDIVLEETKNDQSAEFFGLEEVKLTDINPIPIKQEHTKNQQNTNAQPAKEKSNTTLWIVLAILGIIAGVAFLYYKDSLFGKKQVKEEPKPQVENVEPIVPAVPVERDSVTIDSVKIEY